MNDELYSITSGMRSFMNILTTQIGAARPENLARFCADHFERLQSCQHVLGQHFATIKESRYNRRAFVLCCKEAFSAFDPQAQMTTFDHAILVRALCPNIMTSLLHEIHFLITPLGKEQTRTFHVCDLNFGLYFVILYDEWLRCVKRIFNVESNPQYLKLNAIQEACDECLSNNEPVFDIPSRPAIVYICSDLKAAFGPDSDISYDTFRRACVANNYLRDEMLLLLPPVIPFDKI